MDFEKERGYIRRRIEGSIASFLKPTNYDWARSWLGEFVLITLKRIDYPPSTPVYRIFASGNDDLGIYKDFDDLDAAYRIMERLFEIKTIEPEDLFYYGFERF